MANTKEDVANYLKLYNGYYRWLLDKVMYREMKQSGRSYKQLLLYLRSRKFTWLVPNDVNRAEDGKYLRVTYRMESGINGEIKGSCTFLEMCIALAIRMNDDIFSPDPTASPARWFWIMMENCGLDEFTDDNYDEHAVEKIVNRILNRRFSESGSGGFFPLRHPKENQRNTEMWYMMQNYIQENFDF